MLLFSHSIISDSLWPHGLQHARLPCPSPSPGVCSNSCPLSRWCHPTISTSAIPFSSCLPSFPASGSFPMSRLFASGGRSIGASTSASVLPMNIQGWFPLDWLIWSPCSPRDSQESSPAPQFKSIDSSALSLFYGPTLTSVHDYWKNHSFDYIDLCWHRLHTASFLTIGMSITVEFSDYMTQGEGHRTLFFPSWPYSKKATFHFTWSILTNDVPSLIEFLLESMSNTKYHSYSVEWHEKCCNLSLPSEAIS